MSITLLEVNLDIILNYLFSLFEVIEELFKWGFLINK